MSPEHPLSPGTWAPRARFWGGRAGLGVAIGPSAVRRGRGSGERRKAGWSAVEGKLPVLVIAEHGHGPRPRCVTWAHPARMTRGIRDMA